MRVRAFGAGGARLGRRGPDAAPKLEPFEPQPAGCLPDLAAPLLRATSVIASLHLDMHTAK
jgi:hypothetical protein